MAGGHARVRCGKGWPVAAGAQILPVAASYDFPPVGKAEIRLEDFSQSWGCGARLPDWNRAVRLTHLRTGLAAFCEGQGTTVRNQDGATTLLRALLLHCCHKVEASSGWPYVR